MRIICEKRSSIVFGKDCWIKEGTIIYAKNHSNITFGNNTNTGHHTEISSNNLINIGDFVMMGPYTYITDSNHGYMQKSKPFKLQPMDVGKVIIGNNVWLARGVFVLKDSEISDNTIVAASSVVTKSFPNNVIIGGILSKIISNLNRVC